ncbi:MAG: acyl-CoA thioesterase [Actinomycetota bacterium]|nr:acyl-CoA thioesterase [Actinomycetota bacterium]
MTTWTAPVRFAEVDAQDLVFNSHYLLYCDEAITAFLAEHDLRELSREIRLVASSLVWSGSAHWGDCIGVEVSCSKVGRTSFTMHFAVTASGRDCCRVETTYVLTDAAGAPTPVPDAVRIALSD